MDKFDLFAYLGKIDNEEATYYRGGYYIINKCFFIFYRFVYK